MPSPKRILLFIYNSYHDPIVQGSLFRYLIRYKEELGGSATFELITYEQAEYPMTEEERIATHQELKKWDVVWHPIPYHTGGALILLKKIWDGLYGFRLARRLHREQPFDLIYTIGSIAGGYGLVLKRLLKTKLLIHTFEPHSLFMADFGFWSKQGMRYRVLHNFEQREGMRADYIMTGTDRMINKLAELKSGAKVFKVPSCVDLQKFAPNEQARVRVRKELGIEEKQVLLHLGKFGGIYMAEEAFEVFKAYLDLESDDFFPFLLILSPNDPQWIQQQLDRIGARPEQYFVGKVGFEVVQDYINASDIGFCGIPSLPSQVYRSPIKNGEYWACGKPVLVPSGISEDDLWAESRNVGVVLKSLEKSELEVKMLHVKQLVKAVGDDLTRQCREVAIEYRGIQQTDPYYLEVFGK